MELADIQAAPVTKVATGLYRLAGDDWSIDVDGVTNMADAKTKAVAAFTPKAPAPDVAGLVAGAIKQAKAKGSPTVDDVLALLTQALTTAATKPLDPATGQPL